MSNPQSPLGDPVAKSGQERVTTISMEIRMYRVSETEIDQILQLEVQHSISVVLASAAVSAFFSLFATLGITSPTTIVAGVFCIGFVGMAAYSILSRRNRAGRLKKRLGL